MIASLTAPIGEDVAPAGCRQRPTAATGVGADVYSSSASTPTRSFHELVDEHVQGWWDD